MTRTFERLHFNFPLTEPDQARILSGVSFLCRFSKLHAYYSHDVLEERTLPSLQLGQFRYYSDRDGLPVAFCNWAWLSGTVIVEILRTARDLTPSEFNCGEFPFFCEFLAPFGHCRAIVRDLRAMPSFRGRSIPAIRTKVCDAGPQPPKAKYFSF